MKKVVLKTIFFSSFFVLFLSFLNINAEYLNEDKEGVIFAVLSDLHINDKDRSKCEKLDKALSIINKRVPSIDSYIFTGDYTNSGYIEEYKLFKDIYSKRSLSEEKIIVLMGNHDYWNNMDVMSSKERFEYELKEKLYSIEKIRGYTFISLSTENDFVEGYYSKESLEFAKIEIEKSIEEDYSKPIFIFTHHPPKNTSYGSDVWGNSELAEAFNEYPQVILFAGHSHFPINDERAIFQDKYTVVSTGGIGGIGLEDNTIDGKNPYDSIKESQGLIVKVDKNNKVTIIRMDFANNEEIKTPWIIDNFNKSNFKYTNEKRDNEQPYFSLHSVAKITSRNKNNVNIVFNQAEDNDMVHSYKVELYEKKINKDKEDIIENKVEEFYISSKFYLGKNMPKDLKVSFSNIDIKKEYLVKIYAIDSFDNISSKYIKCNIKN